MGIFDYDYLDDWYWDLGTVEDLDGYIDIFKHCDTGKKHTIGDGYVSGDFKLVAGLDSVDEDDDLLDEDEIDDFPDEKERDRLEHFLQRIEHKMNNVPLAGKYIANIPIMISLVRSYLRKEYPSVPKKTIVAIVFALGYFIFFADMIPDFFPIVGYFDDIIVLAICYFLVRKDIEAYRRWRKRNGRMAEFVDDKHTPKKKKE